MVVALESVHLVDRGLFETVPVPGPRELVGAGQFGHFDQGFLQLLLGVLQKFPRLLHFVVVDIAHARGVEHGGPDEQELPFRAMHREREPQALKGLAVNPTIKLVAAGGGTCHDLRI
ncbi:MAG: hypothetical protein IBX54_07420 [Rhodoferax sp.]|nr:hypothetical protein [Rhodoferax sp.]